jgi:RNA polymerase sigma-70 factor (ECF subfamily)
METVTRIGFDADSSGVGSGSVAPLRLVADESAVLAEAYPRVLRYARRLVRDPAEAEDLTQETFLRAHRARGALRDRQALLAWLYRTATRLRVDRLRQRARRPVEPEAVLEAADPPDTAPPLQQLVEQDEMSACVRGYVADLPDDYRAALLLHELEELTGAEIAELLGVSLPTVKIRLHRARAKLRAALEAGCAFSHDERDVLVCASRGPGGATQGVSLGTPASSYLVEGLTR